MNKHVVDEELEIAYKAIKIEKIANEKNVIQNGFRRQIAAFGAAVMGGSVLSAIAFFSQQGSAEVERKKLLKAIFYILGEREVITKEDKDLFSYAVRDKKNAKEEIVNAAIALKLAMNLYIIEKKDEEKDERKE